MATKPIDICTKPIVRHQAFRQASSLDRHQGYREAPRGTKPIDMIRLNASWLDPIKPDMRFDPNLNDPWASGATYIMHISISLYQSLLDFHLHFFKVKQFFISW